MLSQYGFNDIDIEPMVDKVWLTAKGSGFTMKVTGTTISEVCEKAIERVVYK